LATFKYHYEKAENYVSGLAFGFASGRATSPLKFLGVFYYASGRISVSIWLHG